MASESSDGFADVELPVNDSLDFDEWVSIISSIERSHPNDGKKISQVYDTFLSKFPLCYGYWRKYATHMTRLSTVDRVVEIFEQAVQSATYVVDIWVDYCSFSMLAFEDPSDTRRLFRRAIYFIGKDYLCYSLWDKYIEFELSQQNWSSLTLLCIQTLQFPTKKLNQYYESFKKLVDHFEEDFSCQASSTVEIQPELLQDGEVFVQKKDYEISVVKDLLDVSDNCTRLKALHTYKTMGERYYKNSCQLDKEISTFEAHIRRSYFHVKPLDATQLENWHHYLDFAETRGDFDWVIKLYERCLIPCANYPEYWLRYVDFLEAKGGREIANHALHRATETFLKKMPAVHLFSAMFKEQIGDLIAARALISNEGEMDYTFIKNVIRRANMEKRLGNTVEAFNILKHALNQAEIKETSEDISVLYIHFSRLKYMTTKDVEATRDALVDGIRKFPYCKLLLEELIKFSMLHGASKDIDLVDSVITDAISPGHTESRCLKEEDAEDISTLYLEFVDLCGTIHDIRKAWNRHLKLFPDSIKEYSHKDPLRSASPKLRKQRMENTPASILRCPSADVSSDCVSKQQPSSGERISIPIYTNEQPDLVLGDHVTKQQLLTKKTDDCSQEKRTTLSPQVSEPASYGASEGKISAELIPHNIRAESLSAERIASLSNNEDDNPDKIKNLQPSVGTSLKDVHTQKNIEHDSEKRGNAFPLQSLSLGSRDELSADTLPSTYTACESSRETCKSARSTPDRSTPDRSTSDSGHYKNQDWSVSGSGQKHFEVKTSGHRSWTKLTHDSQQWHQRNNTDRPHRESRSQFRSHPYRKHDQRKVSQQRKHGEVGAQMLSNQGNSSQPPPFPYFQMKQPSQVPYQLEESSNNPVACQGRPVSMQQQNLPFCSESPAQPVMSQPHENPLQASGQYGQMQNTEAYNQMWQYYYYQQQQYFLQQQQWQLHQQHQLPQQPLYQQEQLSQQPPQQQQYIQAEQHYFQPEQSQYLQHQNLQGNAFQHLQYQQQQSQFPQQQQPQQKQDIPYAQQQIQLLRYQLVQPQTQGQQEEPDLKWQKLQSSPADSQSLNVEEVTVPNESGSTGIVAASTNPHPSDESPPK